MQMQMLRLLDGSEDSPLPGRKQANPPATLSINLATVTPGLQRTPSPAVISMMVKSVCGAVLQRFQRATRGSVLSAISAGPAPESVAATL